MLRRNGVAAVRTLRFFLRVNGVRARRKWMVLGTSMICLATTVCAGTINTGPRAGPGSGQSPGSSSQAAAKQQTPPEARVDINHATVEELMKVPGMTATWAARIVRFRPYRTKQDLIDKGVVTSQVYDRIKDYVIAHQVTDRNKQ
jgi:DNA uptake protein ComE-like DNA-binding protein